ncbi:MAG: hypothetical protein V3V35_00770 [Dehalococcoidia bacterium]
MATIIQTGFDDGHRAELVAAEALAAPSRFESDHGRYVAWLRDAAVPLSRELVSKAAEQDIVGVSVALANYEAERFKLIGTVSPPFCRTLDPDDDRICDDEDPTPLGEYGAQIRAVAKEIAAENRRTGVLFPVLREAETLGAVELVQPTIIAALERLLAQTRAITPPDALRQDHDRFVLALDERLGVARRISQAVQARDFDRLLEGFREADLYAASLERAISPTLRPLVAFLFPPDTTAGAGLTSQEAEYLDSLDAAVSRLNAANSSFGRELSRSYPTRSAMLRAIEGADFDGATSALQETLNQIDPPRQFRADHQRLADFFNEFFAERSRGEALASQDLFTVMVDRKDFLLGYLRNAQRSTPPFCRAVVFGDPASVCDDEVPGGDYGPAVRRLFNTYFAVEFGPRVQSFPLGLTQGEVFEGLLLINPEIEEVLETALRELKALQPPAPYEADHQVLVRYVDETLGVARAITQAARDRDAETQRAKFFESFTVLCNAVNALSDEIRPILGPHVAPNPNCLGG